MLSLGMMFGVTMVLGIVLASSRVSAEDNTSVVDEINITVPVSCTMSGTGMDSHNAEINNGQYNSAIGETTLKAFCNDNEGFAIYAIGYTDNEDGKNVLTSSTLGSTYDIVTGTATSGNTSNWAMKLSTVTSPTPTYPIIIAGTSDDTLKAQGDPDYSTFQEVPDNYTKVAYRTSNTDIGTSAEGSTLTTTYQAYISPTQSAGTYTGQVKYTLVHPHDTAAPQIPVSIEDAFAAAGKTKHNGYYKMQDMTTSICEATNTYEADSRAQLIDTRDNQTYYVAKLLDGKCWMTENLNIAGGTELSSDDTDFDSSYTLPTTGNWTVSDGKLILPTSSTSGFNTSNFAYVYNSGNKENCGAPGQTIPCYSYYSWDVAVVGSGRSINTSNTDAPYSICPTGWKLPTSGSQTDNGWKRGDFYVLTTAYGANLENSSSTNDPSFLRNATFNTTPNLLFAGSYSLVGGANFGQSGGYWSSTVYSSGVANGLYFDAIGSTDVASIMGSMFGGTVRCLAR